MVTPTPIMRGRTIGGGGEGKRYGCVVYRVDVVVREARLQVLS